MNITGIIQFSSVRGATAHSVRCITLLLAFVCATGAARTASAQYIADEAHVRLWTDTTLYTGSPVGSRDETVLAPVLLADLKLAGFRLGGALPFAAGWSDSALDLLGGSGTQSGSDFVMGNPSLQALFEVGNGPVLGSIGAGFAFSVPGATVADADEAAGKRALTLAAASRGLWNDWWWLLDTSTLYFPASIRFRDDMLEIGAEGAIGVTFPGGNRDTGLVSEIGGYAAVVSKTSEFGLRLRSYIPIANRAAASLEFSQIPGVSIGGGVTPSQTSAELYAERVFSKFLLLGGGFLLNLDTPYGVFGNGDDIWGARLLLGITVY